MKKIVPIAMVSLLFEIVQYIFAIGVTDITDFIGNTLGGVIGIVAYLIANKLVEDETKTNKILNVLASICTISFILLFGSIFLGNI